LDQRVEAVVIGIGLLGAGRIGRIHGRNAAENARARLVAVADAIPEAARDLGGALGAPVSTVDDILADKAVDAVIVATSTDTHADLVERAARAGKAVFCEKPVDLSSDRIVSCLDVVKAAGTPLMVAFNRRFDPHFGALRKRLADGAIGEPELITILSRDPGPPPIAYIERSGGLYRDMMIHDFDMARFLLLGDEPTEVYAVGSNLVDAAIGKAGDVDTAAVTLKTASGKIVQISCSRRATYGYDQRVEVHGSKGMLRVGNVHESAVEMAGPDGFRTDRVMDFFLQRYADAYRIELDHFIDAVTGGTPVSPSGDDGLRAQRLADAATESSRTGAPVTV
jgi:myo-inositol 2-dehydrogenase / D-chiro-inositol 1-dehydrogenase